MTLTIDDVQLAQPLGVECLIVCGAHANELESFAGTHVETCVALKPNVSGQQVSRARRYEIPVSPVRSMMVQKLSITFPAICDPSLHLSAEVDYQLHGQYGARTTLDARYVLINEVLHLVQVVTHEVLVLHKLCTHQCVCSSQRIGITCPDAWLHALTLYARSKSISPVFSM